jgi:hypothetical protein
MTNCEDIMMLEDLPESDGMPFATSLSSGLFL